jgi:hypothetical protein
LDYEGISNKILDGVKIGCVDIFGQYTQLSPIAIARLLG